MSTGDLDDAFDRFWEDLMFEAEASADPQPAAFFRLYTKLASENGDCIDLTYTPARNERRGAYQVDGFALERDRGDLYLAVSDFRSGKELQTLNAAQIDTLFGRVRRFCELAVQPAFINAVDETSPSFQAAWPIYNGRSQIKRIRVVIFSNARLSTRRKPEMTGEVLGVPFVCSVLDFARYASIISAKGGVEPIEIDVTAVNGSPLPCLPAHSIDGGHTSYLVAVPGTFLAEIYGLHGAKLLEQNVRTFLQARTRVNAGIIKTLEAAPEMFFAYNNGLTATAAGITTAPLDGGGLGIASIDNLQIVNGGQTTASILYASDSARKDRKADLSRVFVQMKLSVVNPDRLEEVVPLISRYANTQNKISEADFFSSHPIHLVLERFSRDMSAPPKPGALSGSKWFYERARGQYRDRLAYGTQAERKRFELEFPREQFIDKTDLAKFEVTFDCRPHIVSRGAQKCFLEFAEKTGKAWEVSDVRFNEHWFRAIVAEAIIFRGLDRLVGRSDWYQADRGYKAQIVTYAIAWLVQHLQNRGQEIALSLVWQRQELPAEIADALARIAPQVAETIKDTPPAMKNVGEYCKQQACWAAVAASKYIFDDRLDGLLIEHDEAELARKETIAAQKVDKDVDFDHVLVAMLADTQPYLIFARSRRLLTPNSDAALKRLTRGDIRLPASERNALKYMVQKMVQAGFELPQQAPRTPVT
ncbi:hypothetical protein J2X65_002334 [Ancylobacter sp. 3268]|uniref:AIPR family protein n=1 Tax=Ancylobacter sp. 3268 TaxID=2817752 RepID=UPI0028669476|nr:AIPR family protein [Ancylobacter sp. 3268]MDR6952973.1 hypothetical protein [Ancylobacter sp. 3268]